MSDAGRMEQFAIATPEGEASYFVYVPATVSRASPVALYVLVHGCNTTALKSAQSSRIHPIADRERFLVLYPDFAPASHPGGCWRWYDPVSQQRDTGDPATIVAEVREVTRRYPIDTSRIYAMGRSSGALITSVLGATYPDVFAAIGLMAGGPYRTYACLGTGRGAPSSLQVETPLLAAQAHDAQGLRSRIVPVLEIHGDADLVVPPPCGEQAIEQWLRTNNLAATGGATQETPTSLAPASGRTVSEQGPRPAEVRQYVDPTGCLTAEKWTVSGMGHAWSGGTAGPPGPFAAVGAEGADPTGPDGAELSWAFFRRFRMSTGSSSPCAPHATPGRASHECTSRRVLTVTVPRSLRAVRATLDQRRVAIRSGRIRVDLRGRPRGTARLIIVGRDQRGRLIRSIRRFRTCAR